MTITGAAGLVPKDPDSMADGASIAIVYIANRADTWNNRLKQIAQYMTTHWKDNACHSLWMDST